MEGQPLVEEGGQQESKLGAPIAYEIDRSHPPRLSQLNCCGPDGTICTILDDPLLLLVRYPAGRVQRDEIGEHAKGGRRVDRKGGSLGRRDRGIGGERDKGGVWKVDARLPGTCVESDGELLLKNGKAPNGPS